MCYVKKASESGLGFVYLQWKFSLFLLFIFNVFKNVFVVFKGKSSYPNISHVQKTELIIDGL